MSLAIETTTLHFGFTFEDLYHRDGLSRIDATFLDWIRAEDEELHPRILMARANPDSFTKKQIAELVVDAAPHLERFIGRLFGIHEALTKSHDEHDTLTPIYELKRKFIAKKAVSGVTAAQAEAIDGLALADDLAALFGEPVTEASFTRHVSAWLENEAGHTDAIQKAARYAAWAALTHAGQAAHRGSVLFRVPHKLDPYHLVDVETVTENGVTKFLLPRTELRHRDGFHLTDRGMDVRRALDQAHYCIKCHNQNKDSCSTGLRDKDGTFRETVFGVTLAGCPLDEKISEMNVVKQNGYSIGALAIATVDNPMCAATGHRICNDCMKSCVFQKQEPVDIPQVETRTLKDVLALPWGFEIYSLLTRWNPLNFSRWLPLAASGYKVLVVGLGPAGFTLAHHLMNDGHTVVGVDGLKIEPLAPEISGVDAKGDRVPFRPIRDVNELYEDLDDRAMAGFGGVAEYGITVRWDKNFLKIIRLLLERRAEFSMYGGVRFGGTMTVESAFAEGFDHIALCLGAGRPTVIPMKNGLSRGVRQASDFLMALQLTGAAKKSSLANLQVRMPIVVIGGGLTAIDTATESLSYYVVQVEKFLARYEALADERGEEVVRAQWSPEERATADEFLAHARELRAEREKAAEEGRKPDLVRLLDSWGGVTIAYRRRLVDSPSYTLNHEEVALAMQEGIRFAELLSPEEVEVDEFGHAAALHLSEFVIDQVTGKPIPKGARVRLPARSILVAAGTQPNTVLAREDPEHVFLDGKWFRLVDESGEPVKPEKVAKPERTAVLMSLRDDGRAISFFGDLHPSFAGNVVKAMGSAKKGYPIVSRVLARRAPSVPAPSALASHMSRELRATVHEVIRLTPTIVEVVIHAPMAARSFQPGQFYRLQNYETLARRVDGTILAMEGIALTGASVDKEKGLLSIIVLEMGGSSDLCALLQPGEPVILMGPTGTPTETPSEETVLLVGGGLGNAVLFSIGQKLRATGSKTIYFAGYKKMIDRYKVEEIEKAADVVIWCCDEGPGFEPGRPGDKSHVGNIVEAMVKYASGEMGAAVPLNLVDRVIAIGSDGMMGAVARARHTVLAPYLRKDHAAIGSINSPMQCMMKEICAQCLQMHKDPKTGQESVVFSCFNQDQCLDHVDWGNLRTRLTQNGVQEKLTKQWIDRSLRAIGVRQGLPSIPSGLRPQ
jgi:NADPH-dependent glutamate synthase beta subunit-like oxidoreductase/NAD(P)H-flavin reductase